MSPSRLPLAPLVLASLLSLPQAPAAQPSAPEARPAPPSGATERERRRFDPEAPAETQYQNVKVLKGCSAAELHDAMEHVEGALGVGCLYCHVRGAMEKDDKPEKGIARKMIRMTEAINLSSFEGRQVITCATCHQGRPKPSPAAALGQQVRDPAAFVKAEPERSPPGPPGGASDAPPPELALPAAQLVLARFVEALGGRKALNELRGLSLSAIQGEGARARELEMSWRPPASMRVVLRGERRGRSFEFTQASDGTRAWARRDRDPAEELSGLHREQALRDAELLPAWLFAAEPPPLETEAIGRIGEDEVVVLELSSPGGIDERFYFDTGTGLLRRRSYDVPTPLGPIPQETDFSDWRRDGAVLLPHVWRSRQAGGSSTMTIGRVSSAGRLDPSLFAPPAGG